MSCGKPHEVDCAQILDQMYVYLDHEMSEQEDVAKVRQHLEECRPCLEQYGLEQAVKSVVARCCRNETAPEALRHKVLGRIAAARAQMSDNQMRDNQMRGGA